jgi:hypothetical protein
MSDAARLAAILGTINSSSSSQEKKDSIFDWLRYIENTSGSSYYYNLRTNQTQWAKPECFGEGEDAKLVHPCNSTVESSDNVSYSISTRPVVESKEGLVPSLSSSNSLHYSVRGLETDKAGRQMAHFFDVGTLDENRKEAARKRKALQDDKSIDWKAYREAKKVKKRKRDNIKLFSDN